MKTPFLGGSTQSRSRNLAYNRAINIYCEIVDTKDGKDVGAFYGCPGLDLLGTVGPGPVRAAFSASNGVLYVVSGNGVYSVNSNWIGTLLGAVGTFRGPAKMVDNGQQLLVVEGTGGWVYNFSTAVFSNVLPGGPGVVPAILAYQDGFALVNFVGTNKFYQSNLNDFSTFQALNFSSADSTPDKIVSMFDLHREVWLFKEKVTEIWVNAGAVGFAFQRLQGVQIPQGCSATYSVSRIGDAIVWLGRSEHGQDIVYMAEGYRAVRISTHAIEFAISQYSTISDAIGYVYQDTGHVFYVLTFPTGGQTFVFDAATRLWHERAAFANGAFSRHISNCFAFAYGKLVVGDFQNGNLYAFNSNTFTDNGAVRKWVRSWRALPSDTETFQPLRFNSLQIDCQTGINIPDGTSPQFVLRWSDDGGHNWSNEIWTDGNQPGNTSTRILFQRLGQTKRGNGFDRIFELSGTDPVPVALIGADMDAEPT